MNDEQRIPASGAEPALEPDDPSPAQASPAQPSAAGPAPGRQRIRRSTLRALFRLVDGDVVARRLGLDVIEDDDPPPAGEPTRHGDGATDGEA